MYSQVIGCGDGLLTDAITSQMRHVLLCVTLLVVHVDPKKTNLDYCESTQYTIMLFPVILADAVQLSNCFHEAQQYVN